MIKSKPQTKRSLLEHSLRVKLPNGNSSACFPKIMFTEKYMFELAKSRSIFRFRMSSKGPDIKFCFTNHSGNVTEDFELDFERAKRVILMINPEFFDISVDSSEANSVFFKLIAHAKYKLSMICDYEGENIPDVVSFFWMRYSEFYCPAFTLSHISSWILKAKTFEKMEVNLIGSDADLALALKQQAQHLVISIGNLETVFGFGPTTLDLARNVVNRSTKKCVLKFADWVWLDNILPIVKVVARAFECLEEFEVIFNNEIYDEEEWLGSCLVDSFKCFRQVVEFLRDMPFSTKFEMHAEESKEVGYYMPIFWLRRIRRQTPELKELWHKTKVIEQINNREKYQTNMWLSEKVGRVKATFTADLTYGESYLLFPLMSYSDGDDMEMGDE